MSVRWRTVPPEDLVWRELDGELVLRNERSGSTHLLQYPASEVLLALLQANTGASVVDIAAALTQEPICVIEEVLSELQRLGLAEPESS